ncbi:dynamin family protein [Streptomyces poonensis]|uniref:Dynamin N-terminal domain-containing protein n=1 Tax=Streptomyces poonensis TaxID=68255 RepID=A0A918UFA9_9ACTN|nr:dynamin family protein [Streptomyces poonensis]GGY99380.1 hypothetical protein GCM10010365_17580 [Streptomyces poonensis]
MFSDRGPQDLGDLARERDRLIELLGRLSAAVGSLEDDAVAVLDAISALERRVRDQRFIVMVVGDFNRGKSTLVNALLGARVLPTLPVPTTAVITEVHYSEQPYAELHPLPADGRAAEPFRVDVTDLRTHLTVRPDAPDTASPYKRAVVGYPVELCRNGVVLVDSPGLNNIEVHDDITLTYLENADAVVMVMDSTAALGQNEREHLEHRIRETSRQHALYVFFVFTKSDIMDEDELSIAIPDIRRRMEPLLQPREALFFVRAKHAVDARSAHDDTALATSGILEFEQSLSVFLAHERGRRAAWAASLELAGLVELGRTTATGSMKLMLMGQAKLERHHAELVPRLQALEARRERLLGLANAQIDQVRTDIEARAREMLRRIGDQCVDWAVEAEIEAKVGASLRIRTKMEAMLEELGAAIAARAEAEVEEWRQDTLVPLLEQQSTLLSELIDHEVAQFEVDLTELRSALFDDDDAGTDPVPAPRVGERVAAGLLGTVGGGVALGYAGFRYGMKGMLRQAAPIMSGLALATLFGVSTGGLALIAVGISTALNARALSRLDKSIRTQIGKEIQQKIADERNDSAARTAAEAVKGLRAATSACVSVLRTEIESIDSQVKVALEARTEGAERVAKQFALLDGVSKDLGDIGEEVGRLVAELEPSEEEASRPPSWS